MTNIVTNADGSVTITLPGHVTEWGIEVEWIPAVVLLVALTVMIIWLILRKKS